MEIINLLMNIDLNMDELIDIVYDVKVKKAIKHLS